MAKRSTGRRRSAVIVVTVLSVVVVFTGLLVLVYGGLHTPPGLRIVASVLSSRLDTPEHDITIRGIRGMLPLRLEMDELSVIQNGEVWMTLEDAEYRLRPWPLFRRRLEFEYLSAARVDLHRLPKREERAPFEVPQIPELPRWITVHALKVDELALHEGVLNGETAILTAAGSYVPVGADNWDVTLAAERVDGGVGEATLAAKITDDRLELALNVNDQDVLPGILDTEGPAVIQLTGAGPTSAWQGELDARFGNTQLAQATLTVDGTRNVDLVSSGTLNLDHPVVPEAIRTRFAGELEYRFAAFLDEAGLLELREARATTPEAALTADGEIQLNERQLALAIETEVADLNRYVAPDEDREALPATLSLALNGPMERVPTQVDGAIEGNRVIVGELTLDTVDGLGVAGEVTVYPVERFMPPELAGIFGDGARVNLAVQQGDDGALRIDTFNFASAPANVAAEGLIDTAHQIADLEVTADIDDLAAFDSWLQQNLAGSAQLSANVDGDSHGMQIVGRLEAANLQVQTAATAGAAFDFSLASAAWTEEGLRDVRIEASGATEAVQVEERTWPQPLQFAFEARGETLDALHLERAQLSDGNLQLAATGTVSGETYAADLEITVQVDSLAELSAMVEQEWAGALEGQAQLVRDAEGDMNGSFNAQVSQPGGLPEIALAVTGGRVSVQGQYTFADNQIVLRELVIDGENGQLTGGFNYATETETIEGQANFAIPRLQALEEALGQSMQGGLVVDARFSGPMGDIAANGEAAITEFVSRDIQAERAEAEFSLAGLPDAPSGDILLILASEDVTAEGEASFALQEDELNVSEFQFTADENTITGNVVWNLDSKTGEGAIDAKLLNLAALSSLSPEPIAGEATADLELTTVDGRLNVQGNAAAQALVTPWLRADAVTADIDLTDPFASPGGTANVRVEQVLIGEDLLLSEATIRAEGDGEALALTVAASGNSGETIRFALEGNGELLLDEQTLRLAALTGDVADYTVALADATTLSWSDSGVEFAPLQINVGDGTFQAEGRWDQDTANISGNWENLPIALVTLAGAPEIDGETAGALTISGPSAAPNAEANLRIANVRSTYAPPDAPLISGNADFTFANGRLQGTFTLDAPDVAGARGDIAVPANFSLAPFAFEFPEGGALDGELTGEAQLASIPQLFGIEDHLLQGAMTANLALAGTIADPRLSGEAVVDEGRYEHTETGAILANIEARVEADGRTLRIARFNATDNANGTVRGEGVVELGTDEGDPIQLELAMNNAQLIRRDDVRARISGELALTGSFKEVRAEGEVAIAPAEIILPEQLPPSELEVIHVKQINVPPELLEQGVVEADLEGEQVATDGDGMTVPLDLRLSFPENLIVRGSGLTSAWRGELEVSGTAADPRLAGTLTVVRGQMTFLGKRFEFADTSTITFDRDQPPSPFVNAIAVVEAQDISAELRLSGEFESLELDITSNPPLPQDEVLSRVLFGRDASNISPVQAIQLARYATAFSGRVGGTRLLGGGRDLPIVDTIDLQTGEGGDVAIGVGKALGEDVYVEILQGTGAESTKARVEVELMPNVKLEGETRPEGDSKVGIFWKKDY